MPAQKATSTAMWFGELFQAGVYKRTQGRIARQVTFAALAVTFGLAAAELFYHRLWFSTNVVMVLSAILLVGGAWFSFRLVNMPRLADFLIAVEAEMNKVSWPSKGELIRSSIVVMFVLFLLASVLFGLDVVWSYVFEAIGILRKAS